MDMGELSKDEVTAPPRPSEMPRERFPFGIERQVVCLQILPDVVEGFVHSVSKLQ